MWHKLTDTCMEQNKMGHIVLVHQSSMFYFVSAAERNYFEMQKRRHMFMGVLFRKCDMLKNVCQFCHGFVPHAGDLWL